MYLVESLVVLKVFFISYRTTESEDNFCTFETMASPVIDTYIVLDDIVCSLGDGDLFSFFSPISNQYHISPYSQKIKTALSWALWYNINTLNFNYSTSLFKHKVEIFSLVISLQLIIVLKTGTWICQYCAIQKLNMFLNYVRY